MLRSLAPPLQYADLVMKLGPFREAAFSLTGTRFATGSHGYRLDRLLENNFHEHEDESMSAMGLSTKKKMRIGRKVRSLVPSKA